jgi:hypothetical protein
MKINYSQLKSLDHLNIQVVKDLYQQFIEPKIDGHYMMDESIAKPRILDGTFFASHADMTDIFWELLDDKGAIDFLR